MSTLDPLLADIRALDPSRVLLVLSGAGISVASGISTFRGPDPDAVWSRDVTEMATFELFRRDPVASWRWYLARFRGLGAAEPNAAHTAVVELELWCTARNLELVVLTQNIDGLHRRAGSRRLIEVHGRADRARCSRDGCRHGAPSGSLEVPWEQLSHFELDPRLETLPRCPKCGDLLRPHVLWFDEMYADHHDYGLAQVEQVLEHLGLVVAVGTSFAVGITAMVQRQAMWLGCPFWSIDPHGTPPAGVRSLRLAAEVALPELVRRLQTEGEDRR